MKIYPRTVALMVMLAAPLALAESPLNPSKSMRDNLKAVAETKTTITVVLSNGKDYRAKVGGVGEDQVLLTGIAGREFFDVLIDIDEIVAIEAQARQP